MAGEPPRIAFYDAYATLDGSGMMLREMIRRLERARFEPLALVPREGALVEGLRQDGCPVTVLAPDPPLDAYGKRLLGPGLVSKLSAAGSLMRYTRRVARWLREQEIALLHCNQTRAALQAGPGARRAHVPVVWNVRLREQFPGWVTRIAGWSADRIIPLTADTFDDLPGRARLLARSTVIPNAVDLTRFHPAVDGRAVRRELGLGESAPVILSVGALVERKGFDVLIRALPEILAIRPEARLLIAGAPPEREPTELAAELIRLAEELGVAHALMLLGRRADVPALMAACDLFVLASRHEGQPGVVLEAMATGRPVVVTPAAAPGIEHGRTGVVVAQDDAGALARAVLGLLADASGRVQMGRAARAQVEAHHDLEAMVRAYERVYDELLGRV